MSSVELLSRHGELRGANPSRLAVAVLAAGLGLAGMAPALADTGRPGEGIPGFRSIGDAVDLLGSNPPPIGGDDNFGDPRVAGGLLDLSAVTALLGGRI